MEAFVHVFPQILSPEIVDSLLNDLALLCTDDYPSGPFSNHLSRDLACSCPLCTPEVLRTCGEAKEPSAESISVGLRVVRGLLGSIPDTHCVNRLKRGARHLHHVDGEESCGSSSSSSIALATEECCRSPSVANLVFVLLTAVASPPSRLILTFNPAMLTASGPGACATVLARSELVCVRLGHYGMPASPKPYRSL